MKNKFTGRLAAAVFVAPFILFGIQMASCSGNSSAVEPASVAATDPVPGKGNPTQPRPKITVICTTQNCGFTASTLLDSSPNQPRPKMWLYVTLTQDMKAGTQLPLEISFDRDSVYAYYKRSDSAR